VRKTLARTLELMVYICSSLYSTLSNLSSKHTRTASSYDMNLLSVLPLSMVALLLSCGNDSLIIIIFLKVIINDFIILKYIPKLLH